MSMPLSPVSKRANLNTESWSNLSAKFREFCFSTLCGTNLSVPEYELFRSVLNPFALQSACSPNVSTEVAKKVCPRLRDLCHGGEFTQPRTNVFGQLCMCPRLAWQQGKQGTTLSGFQVCLLLVHCPPNQVHTLVLVASIW